MYVSYMSGIEMSVTDARDDLGPVTNRVAYGGETIYLTKHGRRAAAMVPVAAAELLEDLEDLIDSEAIDAVRARLAEGVENRVPFARRTPRRDA
jgi:prevent-host-death family protein